MHYAGNCLNLQKYTMFYTYKISNENYESIILVL